MTIPIPIAVDIVEATFTGLGLELVVSLTGSLAVLLGDAFFNSVSEPP